MSVAPLAMDRHAAASMLHALGVGKAPATFQTFKEAEGYSPRPQIIHGPFERLADRLEEQNQKGAGVFVMVNEGDGDGRRAANVRAVRALFVDLDGAPVEPVMRASLPPHIVLETSPSRYHAYWAVTDWPREAFTAAQKALAERFSGDPSVSDVARVMRLAGSWHVKREPRQSRIVELNERAPYSRAQICLGLQLAASATIRRDVSIIPQGARNNTLLSHAAMLRNRGFLAEGVLQRLLTTNATRCRPPLSEAEVRRIVDSAMSYPVMGNKRNWDLAAEFAHPAYSKARFAAKCLYAEALRQFDGSNDGRISLTLTDLKDRGFKNPKTLASAKRECLRLGLLATARPASYGRGGASRQCALYSLPLVAKTATNTKPFSGENDPPDCFNSSEPHERLETA